ncbi:MAG: AAA family ATPase [Candidatus Accumulibacter sp.]|nr:AAA family ATPase [Accumulibacter sp.]MBK8115935.1 AAA family ATPase [Accumulibacter sp.]
MLKRLSLKNIGPAQAMDLEFGDRLNLITGDNGLGKSFLLDIAWWAMTRKWPAEINPA